MAFCPLLSYQLAYLKHVHELDADQCTLGLPKGLEPQHRTGDPFDAAVILFHHIGEILDLTDFDRRPCASLYPLRATALASLPSIVIFRAQVRIISIHEMSPLKRTIVAGAVAASLP